MRSYLVKWEDKTAVFVQARSPAQAVERVANKIIPNNLRWGSTVAVTTLTSGLAIDHSLHKTRNYRVCTNRIIERVERCV